MGVTEVYGTPGRPAWAAHIADAAPTPHEGPLILGLEFHLPPAMHPPRLAQLITSTLDALTDAQVYADDSCVVGVVATKVYADDREPGATIHILTAQETQ